ncbi:hypothetical protein LG632_26310, partial [Streptomyces sp. SMC 277]|nr:hypothetical protein [Streptomyces antimicrobicus]
MSDDVVLRKVGPDPECRWCGEPVSQLGTRTPRRYCKRSHRQRAYEAERLGLPMKRDRPQETGPRPVPAPVRRAQEDRGAVLFLADAMERASVDVPAPAPEPTPVPAAEVRRPAPEPAPLPRPVRGRRRAGMTAAAIPLPEPTRGDAMPLWEDP